MLNAIDLVVDYISDLVNLLDSIPLWETISYFDLILGFLLCAIAAAVFWKGARA